MFVIENGVSISIKIFIRLSITSSADLYSGDSLRNINLVNWNIIFIHFFIFPTWHLVFYGIPTFYKVYTIPAHL